MEEVKLTGTILSKNKISISKLYEIESYINEVAAKEVYSKYGCLIRTHLSKKTEVNNG